MRFQTLFEARWIFAVLIILFALCWFLMSWLWVLFFFLIGYTFFFFRDPERAVPAEPDVVVAAADGVVVEIRDEAGRVRGTKTNRKGLFRLGGVRKSTYKFKVTMNGFKSVVGDVVVSKKANKTDEMKIIMNVGV